MDYDVLILGGGIFGCAIAYELSKYSLNIAVIEKEYDIASDVTRLNSAVVFDGIENDNSLMALLENQGNKLLKNIIEKFNIPYHQSNLLYIAYNGDEEVELRKKYKKAKTLGIEGIELIDGDKVKELEPSLKREVKLALMSKNTGIVSPYDLAIAMGEVAFDNGVNFRFNERVLNIEKIATGFNVVTTKNRFKSKFVINTIPDKNYDIANMAVDEGFEKIRKSVNYIMMENEDNNGISNIIFSRDDVKDETSFLIPTDDGLIGTFVHDELQSISDTRENVKRIVSGIRTLNIVSFFGDTFYKDHIVINDSFTDSGYIKISGRNYAEITMTPAIANLVCETIRKNIKCVHKKGFLDKRREVYKFSSMENLERQGIIEVDKKYGHIVCYCNMVTEGEVVDAITRPLGARTIEGVVRRTGVCQGSCKGANCLNKIVEIMARELNQGFLDIIKDTKESYIVTSRMKEFDEI